MNPLFSANFEDNSQNSQQEAKLTPPKYPKAVLDQIPHTIFAFPPNRDTLGATAYSIVENGIHILIDCPAWNETNQQFLQNQGGVDWLFITHRGGIGKAREIQQAFNCQILIQEQEAYLLPGLVVTSFNRDFTLNPQSRAIWTPGHSPGASCLYYQSFGGILFTGRHLVPDQQGEPVPLKTSKTFHWPRQLRSVNLLLEQFTQETLSLLCPGANTGLLRGKRSIDQAYLRLSKLDLTAYLQAKSIL